MDAALITTECLDSRIKEENVGILCKLDKEKVFDHVNWGFLLNLLKKMNYDPEWVNWIKFSISTVKFPVLINGSSEGIYPKED